MAEGRASEREEMKSEAVVEVEERKSGGDTSGPSVDTSVSRSRTIAVGITGHLDYKSTHKSLARPI